MQHYSLGKPTMSMFQPTRPDAMIPFMEAESITWPEYPFLFDTSLSPRVLLILNRVCVSIKNSITGKTMVDV